MADKRVVCRASLGFENLLYGFTVSCITAKAVNGLCGETDYFAVLKVLSRILDRLGII